MDIAEHRLPQDGRLTTSVGARRLDLRASTYPTIHGEKIVLRVLDQGALRLELSALGMRSPLVDEFRDIIRRPEGLVLITGPTGSGKTSTLYAALAELVETGKNITTIEIPSSTSSSAPIRVRSTRRRASPSPRDCGPCCGRIQT